jgi:hypothetical protein
MLARMEMMAMTTSSSIRVKANRHGRIPAGGRILAAAERPLIAIMSRKTVILILCALILGGLYAYYFSDWFAPPGIQIISTVRPNTRMNRRGPPRRDAPKQSSHTVSFAFNRRLALTEVKVIPASDVATNKFPHPIWHLISDSNSVPTKAVLYGDYIRGMRPAVKGAWPDPLVPNTAYKLYLASDIGKIEHDFKTPPGLPAPK